MSLKREAEIVRFNNGMRPQTLDAGGAGPYDPGMEARVARLERDVDELKQDMKTVLSDLAFIKGKISQMPNIWQAIGLQITFAGLLFAAMHFGLR